MPKFLYKAKVDPTKTVAGTVVAESKFLAIQKITQQGLYLLSVDEDLKTASFDGEKEIYYKKVNFKDLATLTRQLADLLESGLTIVKSLDVLYNQTENKNLKEVALDLKESCEKGSTFSQALSKYPYIFSNLFVSMVKTGETGGDLAKVLENLADFSDKQLEMRNKIRSALAYPALMAFVGVGTIVVLLTFVIPRLIDMFSDLGQNLPLPTVVLINVSNAVKSYWWLIAASFFGFFAAVANIYKTKEGRKNIDRFKLNIAFFGQMIKKSELARIFKTLATLLNNGVSILEALAVVNNTVNNAIIKEELEKITSFVREGQNLAMAVSQSSLMPAMVVNMIAVGEQAGTVSKALFKVSQTYERETDSTVKLIMSLIEPVMILVLGLIVGFIVIAMLLPIFEINFLAK